MPKILKYQIWRHQDKNNSYETGDVYICTRGTQKDAQNWIETQKNQMYNHSWYFIKQVEYGTEGNYND